MSKRIIIVGGGHNGLVCACYLARAGARVTVLERRSILGGAAVTEEFHPGFRNSTLSYTVSLLHPRIIAELNLEAHGLRILPRPVNNLVPLGDGRYLVSSADRDETRASIAQFSPSDAEGLEQFSEQLSRIVPLVRDVMMQTPPALTGGFAPTDLMRLFRLSRHYARLADADRRFLWRLMGSSAGEILDDTFESDPVKALLGFDAVVGHYASPWAPGSAYVMLHHVVGETAGRSGTWGHAIGGMGAISDAIAAEARDLGVRLLTDAGAAEVLVKGGRTIGVRTTAGDTFDADLVVAAVNPKLLFCELLDPGVVAPDTLAHFQHWKCVSGTFRMNVALSALPAFPGIEPPRLLSGGIIMAPSLDYMERAWIEARQHGFSRHPIVEMLIPSVIDDTLAPPGKHVASLFCQHFDPDIAGGWTSARDNAAETIIRTVEAFAPGFTDLIVGRQVHSPLDLEERFGLIGGDIFHGRLSIDQLFSARPMLGMSGYRTDIEGLWMCSAGTHPGGGVSGLPGHHAAREILRRS